MILNKHILLYVLLLCPALYAATQDKGVSADLQKAIDQQEAIYGAYHPALSELHLSLGTTLQQQGEHEKAIQAFKQAMHINRVDQGIKSLSQEPMLRGQIDSHRALDQPLPLATLYQWLIDLYQQNHGTLSVKLIPLLQEAGNWHREQYLWQADTNAFAHLLESTRMLTLARSIGRTQLSGRDTKQLPVLQSLVKNHYYLVQHYSLNRPALSREYIRRNSRRFRPRYTGESRLVYRNNYDRYIQREKSRLARQYQRELIQQHTESGLAGYRNIAAIHAKAGDVSAQAAALAAQGDWIRLFHKSFQQANNLYRQSWKLLKDSGDQQTLQQLFAKPLLLPVFHHQNPATYSRLTSSQLAKVQASISQTGQATNIKVLETVPVSSNQIASKALRQLRQSQFRSRMVDGEPVDSESIELSLFINK